MSYLPAVVDRLRRRSWPAMLLCGLMAFAMGCSKEKLKQALEDAKAQTKSLTESTVQAIEDKLPERGSLTLETMPATPAAQRLDFELIAIGDGRPNVIQIVSYDPRQPGRTFPAIMLHGTTDASTTSSLVGQTVACDFYFQADAETPIAATKPGASVSVTFDAVNQQDNVLNATFGAVDLLRADNQTVAIGGGKMVAVIRGEGN